MATMWTILTPSTSECFDVEPWEWAGKWAKWWSWWWKNSQCLVRKNGQRIIPLALLSLWTLTGSGQLHQSVRGEIIAGWVLIFLNLCLIFHYLGINFCIKLKHQNEGNVIFDNIPNFSPFFRGNHFTFFHGSDKDSFFFFLSLSFVSLICRSLIQNIRGYRESFSYPACYLHTCWHQVY